jgi:NADH/NAD ratio-sensing transcriptional regulator Rex
LIYYFKRSGYKIYVFYVLRSGWLKKKNMKIALIGYGAMGKLIKTLAENKNHEITLIIDEADANLSAEELAEKLKSVERQSVCVSQNSIGRRHNWLERQPQRN